MSKMILKTVNQKQNFKVDRDDKLELRAVKGEEYRLVETATGKTPESVEIRRDGDDLIIYVKEDNATVIIRDFWKECSPANKCYAIFDSPSVEGGELVGETVVTQEGPVLDALLAGKIGTLEDNMLAPLMFLPHGTINWIPAIIGLAGVGIAGFAIAGGSSSKKDSGDNDHGKIPDDGSGDNDPVHPDNPDDGGSQKPGPGGNPGGNPGGGTPGGGTTTPSYDPIVEYGDDVPGKTGEHMKDPVTNDNTPSFVVDKDIPQGSTPELIVDGHKVPATYDRDKNTLTPDSPLPEGERDVTYEVDGKKPGKSFKVTIDTTPPGKPVVTDDNGDKVIKVPDDDATTITVNIKDPDGNTTDTVTLTKDPKDDTWKSDKPNIIPDQQNPDDPIRVPGKKIPTDGSIDVVNTDDAGNDSPKVDSEKGVETIPAPQIAHDGKGGVNVTMPKGNDIQEGDEVVVTFNKPDGSGEAQVTLEKVGNTWKVQGTNDKDVEVSQDGVAHIPGKHIQDDSDVTAQTQRPGSTIKSDEVKTHVDNENVLDKLPMEAPDNGDVIVTLPSPDSVKDHPPVQDGDKVTISYFKTGQNTPTTVEVTRGNGQWTTTNTDVEITTDSKGRPAVKIPADEVEDKSTVTANEETTDGLKSREDSQIDAKSPGSQVSDEIPAPEVVAVKGFGSAEVTVPTKDTKGTPAKTNDELNISYVDEDGNKVDKKYKYDEGTNKWTNTADPSDVIDGSDPVKTIKGPEIKDNTEVKSWVVRGGEEGETKKDTVDSENSLPPVPVECPDDGTAIIKLPDPDDNGNVPGDTVVITYVPEGKTDPETVVVKLDGNKNWVPQPGKGVEVTTDPSGKPVAKIPEDAVKDKTEVTASEKRLDGRESSTPGKDTAKVPPVEELPTPALTVDDKGGFSVDLPDPGKDKNLKDGDKITISFEGEDGNKHEIPATYNESSKTWEVGNDSVTGKKPDVVGNKVNIPGPQVVDNSEVSATPSRPKTGKTGEPVTGTVNSENILDPLPVTPEKGGDVVVGLPDPDPNDPDEKHPPVKDGDTVTITYTPEDGTGEKKITVKRENGEWKSDDPSIPVSKDPDGKPVIRIPEDKVEDESTVTVTEKTDDGLESREPGKGKAETPPSKVNDDIPSPDVIVENLKGAAKVVTPKEDSKAGKPLEDGDKLVITYKDEDGHNVEKSYTYSDFEKKWINDADKNDKLDQGAQIDIPGKEIMDDGDVTAKTVRSENGQDKSCDPVTKTVEPSNILPPLEIEVPDSGDAIVHLPDDPENGDTVTITWTPEPQNPNDPTPPEKTVTIKYDEPSGKWVPEDPNDPDNGDVDLTTPGQAKIPEENIQGEDKNHPIKVTEEKEDGTKSKEPATKTPKEPHTADELEAPKLALDKSEAGVDVTMPTDNVKTGDKVVVTYKDEADQDVTRTFTKTGNGWSDDKNPDATVPNGGTVNIPGKDIKDESQVNAKTVRGDLEKPADPVDVGTDVKEPFGPTAKAQNDASVTVTMPDPSKVKEGDIVKITFESEDGGPVTVNVERKNGAWELTGSPVVPVDLVGDVLTIPDSSVKDKTTVTAGGTTKENNKPMLESEAEAGMVLNNPVIAHDGKGGLDVTLPNDTKNAKNGDKAIVRFRKEGKPVDFDKNADGDRVADLPKNPKEGDEFKISYTGSDNAEKNETFKFEGGQWKPEGSNKATIENGQVKLPKAEMAPNTPASARSVDEFVEVVAKREGKEWKLEGKNEGVNLEDGKIHVNGDQVDDFSTAYAGSVRDGYIKDGTKREPDSVKEFESAQVESEKLPMVPIEAKEDGSMVVDLPDDSVTGDKVTLTWVDEKGKSHNANIAKTDNGWDTSDVPPELQDKVSVTGDKLTITDEGIKDATKLTAQDIRQDGRKSPVSEEIAKGVLPDLAIVTNDDATHGKGGFYVDLPEEKVKTGDIVTVSYNEEGTPEEVAPQNNLYIAKLPSDPKDGDDFTVTYFDNEIVSHTVTVSYDGATGKWVKIAGGDPAGLTIHDDRIVVDGDKVAQGLDFTSKNQPRQSVEIKKTDGGWETQGAGKIENGKFIVDGPVVQDEDTVEAKVTRPVPQGADPMEGNTVTGVVGGENEHDVTFEPIKKYHDDFPGKIEMNRKDPLTNDATPSFVVDEKVPDNVTPKLFVDGNEVPAVWDSDAKTLTPVDPISEGDHSINYKVGQKTPKDPFNITIDTTPPKDPVITDNNGDKEIEIPDDDTETITVNIKDPAGNPTETVTLTKQPDGSWKSSDPKTIPDHPKTADSITVPGGKIPNGGSIDVVNEDEAGNSSPKIDSEKGVIELPAPKLEHDGQGGVNVEMPSGASIKEGDNVTITWKNPEDGSDTSVTFTKGGGDEWIVVGPNPNEFEVVGGKLKIPGKLIKDDTDVDGVTKRPSEDLSSGKATTHVLTENILDKIPMEAPDNGDVVVTLPSPETIKDHPPVQDGDKVFIDYYKTGEDTPTPVEVTRENGEWKSNNPAVEITTDSQGRPAVKIPADEVKDKSTVTAKEETAGGLKSKEPSTELAKDPGSQPDSTIPTPDVAKVEGFGSAKVTVPTKDTADKPAKDGDTLKITYTDEKDNAVEKEYKYDEKSDKWTNTKDPSDVIEGSNPVKTITGPEVKDNTDVTSWIERAGKEGKSDKDTVDSEAVLPPVPVECPDDGTAIIKLPDPDDNGNVPGDTVVITYVPEGGTDPETVVVTLDDNKNWVPEPGKGVDVTTDPSGKPIAKITEETVKDETEVTAREERKDGRESSDPGKDTTKVPPEPVEILPIPGLTVDDKGGFSVDLPDPKTDKNLKDGDKITITFKDEDGKTHEIPATYNETSKTWEVGNDPVTNKKPDVVGNKVTIPGPQVLDNSEVSATPSRPSADKTGDPVKGTVNTENILDPLPVTPEKNGDVVVGLPDPDPSNPDETHPPVKDGDTVTITYTPEDGGTDKKVTVERKNGEWKSDDPEIPVTTDDNGKPVVKIPEDKVKDGSTVTVTEKTDDGLESREPGKGDALTPENQVNPDVPAPAIKVDGLKGGAEVTTPVDQAKIGMPLKDGDVLEIFYPTEVDGQNAKKTYTYDEFEKKWVNDADTSDKVAPGGTISINGKEIKDDGKITAQTIRNPDDPDVAKSKLVEKQVEPSNILPGLDIEVPDSGEAIVDLPDDPDDGETVTITWTPEPQNPNDPIPDPVEVTIEYDKDKGEWKPKDPNNPHNDDVEITNDGKAKIPEEKIQGGDDHPIEAVNEKPDGTKSNPTEAIPKEPVDNPVIGKPVLSTDKDGSGVDVTFPTNDIEEGDVVTVTFTNEDGVDDKRTYTKVPGGWQVGDDPKNVIPDGQKAHIPGTEIKDGSEVNASADRGTTVHSDADPVTVGADPFVKRGPDVVPNDKDASVDVALPDPQKSQDGDIVFISYENEKGSGTTQVSFKFDKDSGAWAPMGKDYKVNIDGNTVKIPEEEVKDLGLVKAWGQDKKGQPLIPDEDYAGMLLENPAIKPDSKGGFDVTLPDANKHAKDGDEAVVKFQKEGEPVEFGKNAEGDRVADLPKSPKEGDEFKITYTGSDNAEKNETFKFEGGQWKPEGDNKATVENGKVKLPKDEMAPNTPASARSVDETVEIVAKREGGEWKLDNPPEGVGIDNGVIHVDGRQVDDFSTAYAGSVRNGHIKGGEERKPGSVEGFEDAVVGSDKLPIVPIEAKEDGSMVVDLPDDSVAGDKVILTWEDEDENTSNPTTVEIVKTDGGWDTSKVPAELKDKVSVTGDKLTITDEGIRDASELTTKDVRADGRESPVNSGVAKGVLPDLAIVTNDDATHGKGGFYVDLPEDKVKTGDIVTVSYNEEGTPEQVAPQNNLYIAKLPSDPKDGDDFTVTYFDNEIVSHTVTVSYDGATGKWVKIGGGDPAGLTIHDDRIVVEGDKVAQGLDFTSKNQPRQSVEIKKTDGGWETQGAGKIENGKFIVDGPVVQDEDTVEAKVTRPVPQGADPMEGNTVTGVVGGENEHDVTFEPITKYHDDVLGKVETNRTDPLTNDATPSFVVDEKVPDNVTPKLLVDNKEVPAVWDSDAKTLTPVDPIPEGTRKINYKVGQKEPSKDFEITIDTTPPKDPVITDNNGDKQIEIPGDDTETITINIKDPAGNPTETVKLTKQPDGSWKSDKTDIIPDHPNNNDPITVPGGKIPNGGSIDVVNEDEAGNSSPKIDSEKGVIELPAPKLEHDGQGGVNVEMPSGASIKEGDNVTITWKSPEDGSDTSVTFTKGGGDEWTVVGSNPNGFEVVGGKLKIPGKLIKDDTDVDGVTKRPSEDLSSGKATTHVLTENILDKIPMEAPDNGDVVVTLPSPETIKDHPPVQDGDKVFINYYKTGEDTPTPVEVTRENGEWKTNNPAVEITTDSQGRPAVKIPADEVKDKSPVTAKEETAGGLKSKEPSSEMAKDPGSQPDSSIPTPDVAKVEGFGSAKVTVPTKDTADKPAKDGDTLKITYTDENDNLVEKEYRYDEKSNKWTNTADSNDVIDGDNPVKTIPGKDIKDHTDVTSWIERDGKEGKHDSDTVDSEKVLDPLPVDPKDNGDVVVKLPDPNNPGGNHPPVKNGDKVIITYTPENGGKEKTVEITKGDDGWTSNDPEVTVTTDSDGKPIAKIPEDKVGDKTTVTVREETDDGLQSNDPGTGVARGPVLKPDVEAVPNTGSATVETPSGEGTGKHPENGDKLIIEYTNEKEESVSKTYTYNEKENKWVNDKDSKDTVTGGEKVTIPGLDIKDGSEVKSHIERGNTVGEEDTDTVDSQKVLDPLPVDPKDNGDVVVKLPDPDNPGVNHPPVKNGDKVIITYTPEDGGKEKTVEIIKGGNGWTSNDTEVTVTTDPDGKPIVKIPENKVGDKTTVTVREETDDGLQSKEPGTGVARGPVLKPDVEAVPNTGSATVKTPSGEGDGKHPENGDKLIIEYTNEKEESVSKTYTYNEKENKWVNDKDSKDTVTGGEKVTIPGSDIKDGSEVKSHIERGNTVGEEDTDTVDSQKVLDPLPVDPKDNGDVVVKLPDPDNPGVNHPPVKNGDKVIITYTPEDGGKEKTVEIIKGGNGWTSKDPEVTVTTDPDGKPIVKIPEDKVGDKTTVTVREETDDGLQSKEPGTGVARGPVLKPDVEAVPNTGSATVKTPSGEGDGKHPENGDKLIIKYTNEKEESVSKTYTYNEKENKWVNDKDTNDTVTGGQNVTIPGHDIKDGSEVKSHIERGKTVGEEDSAIVDSQKVLDPLPVDPKDNGDVVVKLPDPAPGDAHPPVKKGDKVIITYTPENGGKEKTVEITKGDDGWTSNDTEVTVTTDPDGKPIVKIPEDKVGDKTTVTVREETGDGLQSKKPGTGIAKAPVPVPDVEAVENTGSATVKTPSSEGDGKHPENGDKLIIEYTNEKKEGVSKTYTYNEKENKWVNDKDTNDTVTGGQNVTIPGSDIKDGSEVKSHIKRGNIVGEEDSATVDSEKVLDPLPVVPKENGDVVVKLPDPAPGDAHPPVKNGDKVIITYTPENGGKEKTVEIIKGDNGWTSNDTEVTVTTDPDGKPIVKIPENKVGDKTTVTVREETDDGLQSKVPGTGIARGPVLKPDVEAVPNTGSATVETPSGEGTGKHPENGDKLIIEYTNEKEESVSKTYTYNEKENKWVNDKDSKDTVTGGEKVTIPGSDILDKSKVKSHIERGKTVGEEDSATVDSEKILPPLLVDCPDDGTAIIDLPDTPKKGDKVVINYIPEGQTEPTPVTVTCDEDGKWTIPTPLESADDGDDKKVKIPADVVKDKTDVTVVEERHDGTTSKEPGKGTTKEPVVLLPQPEIILPDDTLSNGVPAYGFELKLPEGDETDPKKAHKEDVAHLTFNRSIEQAGTINSNKTVFSGIDAKEGDFLVLEYVPDSNLTWDPKSVKYERKGGKWVLVDGEPKDVIDMSGDPTIVDATIRTKATILRPTTAEFKFDGTNWSLVSTDLADVIKSKDPHSFTVRGKLVEDESKVDAHITRGANNGEVVSETVGTDALPEIPLVKEDDTSIYFIVDLDKYRNGDELVVEIYDADKNKSTCTLVYGDSGFTKSSGDDIKMTINGGKVTLLPENFEGGGYFADVIEHRQENGEKFESESVLTSFDLSYCGMFTKAPNPIFKVDEEKPAVLQRLIFPRVVEDGAGGLKYPLQDGDVLKVYNPEKPEEALKLVFDSEVNAWREVQNKLMTPKNYSAAHEHDGFNYYTYLTFSKTEELKAEVFRGENSLASQEYRIIDLNPRDELDTVVHLTDNLVDILPMNSWGRNTNFRAKATIKPGSNYEEIYGYADDFKRVAVDYKFLDSEGKAIEITVGDQKYESLHFAPGVSFSIHQENKKDYYELNMLYPWEMFDNVEPGMRPAKVMLKTIEVENEELSAINHWDKVKGSFRDPNGQPTTANSFEDFKAGWAKVFEAVFKPQGSDYITRNIDYSKDTDVITSRLTLNDSLAKQVANVQVSYSLISNGQAVDPNKLPNGITGMKIVPVDYMGHPYKTNLGDYKSKVVNEKGKSKPTEDYTHAEIMDLNRSEMVDGTGADKNKVIVKLPDDVKNGSKYKVSFSSKLGDLEPVADANNGGKVYELPKDAKPGDIIKIVCITDDSRLFSYDVVKDNYDWKVLKSLSGEDISGKPECPITFAGENMTISNPDGVIFNERIVTNTPKVGLVFVKGDDGSWKLSEGDSIHFDKKFETGVEIAGNDVKLPNEYVLANSEIETSFWRGCEFFYGRKFSSSFDGYSDPLLTSDDQGGFDIKLPNKIGVDGETLVVDGDMMRVTFIDQSTKHKMDFVFRYVDIEGHSNGSWHLAGVWDNELKVDPNDPTKKIGGFTDDYDKSGFTFDKASGKLHVDAGMVADNTLVTARQYRGQGTIFNNDDHDNFVALGNGKSIEVGSDNLLNPNLKAIEDDSNPLNGGVELRMGKDEADYLLNGDTVEINYVDQETSAIKQVKFKWDHNPNGDFSENDFKVVGNAENVELVWEEANEEFVFKLPGDKVADFSSVVARKVSHQSGADYQSSTEVMVSSEFQPEYTGVSMVSIEQVVTGNNNNQAGYKINLPENAVVDDELVVSYEDSNGQLVYKTYKYNAKDEWGNAGDLIIDYKDDTTLNVTMRSGNKVFKTSEVMHDAKYDVGVDNNSGGPVMIAQQNGDVSVMLPGGLNQALNVRTGVDITFLSTKNGETISLTKSLKSSGWNEDLIRTDSYWGGGMAGTGTFMISIKGELINDFSEVKYYADMGSSPDGVSAKITALSDARYKEHSDTGSVHPLPAPEISYVRSSSVAPNSKVPMGQVEIKAVQKDIEVRKLEFKIHSNNTLEGDKAFVITKLEGEAKNSEFVKGSNGNQWHLESANLKDIKDNNLEWGVGTDGMPYVTIYDYGVGNSEIDLLKPGYTVSAFTIGDFQKHEPTKPGEIQTINARSITLSTVAGINPVHFGEMWNALSQYGKFAVDGNVVPVADKLEVDSSVNNLQVYFHVGDHLSKVYTNALYVDGRGCYRFYVKDSDGNMKFLGNADELHWKTYNDGSKEITDVSLDVKPSQLSYGSNTFYFTMDLFSSKGVTTQTFKQFGNESPYALITSKTVYRKPTFTVNGGEISVGEDMVTELNLSDPSSVYKVALVVDGKIVASSVDANGVIRTGAALDQQSKVKIAIMKNGKFLAASDEVVYGTGTGGSGSVEASLAGESVDDSSDDKLGNGEHNSQNVAETRIDLDSYDGSSQLHFGGVGNILNVKADITGGTDIVIDVNGGDDKVEVGGSVNMTGSIVLGGGDDVAHIHGDLLNGTIKAGDGNDSVRIGGAIRNGLIETGDGDDVVSVVGEMFGGKIDMGAGDDVLNVWNHTGTVVDMGSGKDSVNVVNTTPGAVVGEDGVHLNLNLFSNTEIFNLAGGDSFDVIGKDFLSHNATSEGGNKVVINSNSLAHLKLDKNSYELFAKDASLEGENKTYNVYKYKEDVGSQDMFIYISSNINNELY